MADTPVGVPAGDASLDGTRPSRAIVTVAEKLRALADWLDAHPGAKVAQVITYPQTWRVHSFAANTPEEMQEMASALEPGGWTFRDDGHAFYMSRPIVPGVEFEFFLSRPKTEEAA